MVVENSLDSHKPVEIGDLLPLTMQERGGYQEVQSAAGSGRAGRFKKLLLGDPEGLSRPLARDGLSSGDASGGTGGISGTTDLRCPPARAGRRGPHSVQTAPLGCVLGWVLDMGFRLCHGTRSSSSEAAPPCGAPLLGLPESYWASRGDAAPGAIAGVEGKRIRTPGAVE